MKERRPPMTSTTLSGRSVLITGGNRGTGRVYAGTRGPFAHNDSRVTTVPLDVTDGTQIQNAVEKVESLDLLVNNAGLVLYEDLSDPSALEQHLDVNLFGAHRMIRAF